MERRRKASGAQVAVGSRAVDRSLVGVHQPRAARSDGPRLQSRDARGHRPAVPRYAVRLQAVSRRRPAAKSSRGSNWKASASTSKCCSSRKSLGYQAVEVPVRWDNVEGTKVSMFGGLVAFLDLLRVRLNGLQGKYR